jgi:hypothetical protein
MHKLIPILCLFGTPRADRFNAIEARTSRGMLSTTWILSSVKIWAQIAA